MTAPIDVKELADELAPRIARALDDRPLYSPKTLAERLNVSPRTVHTMLSTGVIASFKVEGARKIDPAEVDRYLETQKAAAA